MQARQIKANLEYHKSSDDIIDVRPENPTKNNRRFPVPSIEGIGKRLLCVECVSVETTMISEGQVHRARSLHRRTCQ